MISRYAGRSIDQGSHVMLSKYRSLALCAFFVLPALLLSACGSDVPGNSVAKVGDQSIRRSTFDHWMQIAAVSAAGQTATTGAAPKAQVPDAPSFTKCIAQKKATAGKPAKGQPEPTEAQLKGQCQQEYNQLRDQVLEFLIRGNWIEQETRKQNLKVSDKDVQKQIDAAVKQAFQNPGDFQKFLQRSGLTQADVFYQQRNQLLQQKLTEKVTKAQGNVTDAQIQQYYDKNKSKFSTPERRDLRIVLTKTQAKAEQARKALESGQSWADVDEEVLDRPGLQGAGRQARRRREGPAGEGARRRHLQGRQGQARRPGQDPVRLLHPRGLEDRARPSSSRSSSRRRRSSRSSPATTSARRSTRSARTTATAGRPRRAAARATRRPIARTARRRSRPRRPPPRSSSRPPAPPAPQPSPRRPCFRRRRPVPPAPGRCRRRRAFRLRVRPIGSPSTFTPLPSSGKSVRPIIATCTRFSDFCCRQRPSPRSRSSSRRCCPGAPPPTSTARRRPLAPPPRSRIRRPR